MKDQSKKYWESVFDHIEKGGYTMSGLSNDQIEKIIDLMRNKDGFHGYDSPEMEIVTTMLRQVSPRTAIVLYTLAWSRNSNLAGSPTDRQNNIQSWMGQTFKEPVYSKLLSSAVSPNRKIHIYGWYADDTIGNLLL